MGLFNKKKAEKNCCCGSSCTPEKMAQAEDIHDRAENICPDDPASVTGGSCDQSDSRAETERQEKQKHKIYISFKHKKRRLMGGKLKLLILLFHR